MIEIMIVVAIIGGIMALATYVMFPSDDARLQEQANRLAGTIKYLYNEAAIKNKYYRLVFNLEEGTYHVESSSEPFYIALEGQEKAPLPAAAGEGEGEAREEAQGDGEEEVAGDGFSPEESMMLKPVKLGTGIKIKDIFVLHSPERKETGMVQVYFLPNGWAEPTVINLSDEDEESFYSLEVNPLTGKSTIRSEYHEANPEDFRNPSETPLGGRS